MSRGILFILLQVLLFLPQGITHIFSYTFGTLLLISFLHIWCFCCYYKWNFHHYYANLFMHMKSIGFWMSIFYSDTLLHLKIIWLSFLLMILWSFPYMLSNHVWIEGDNFAYSSPVLMPRIVFSGLNESTNKLRKWWRVTVSGHLTCSGFSENVSNTYICTMQSSASISLSVFFKASVNACVLKE